jgi:hypothetical protein
LSADDPFSFLALEFNLPAVLLNLYLAAAPDARLRCTKDHEQVSQSSPGNLPGLLTDAGNLPAVHPEDGDKVKPGYPVKALTWHHTVHKRQISFHEQ